MDRTRVLALAIGLVLAAPAAEAVTLQQVFGDSFAGSVDILSFPSFDPALGTLDRVNVSIVGSLTLQGPSQTNFISTQGGPVPLPIGFAATVTQSFVRIGIGNRGFGFDTPARFLFNGLASGAGEQLILNTQFSYSFSFTDITDLFGFAIPTFSGASNPPAAVIGTRGDFLDLAPPLDGEEIEILAQTQIDSLTGILGGLVTVGGSVLVTYLYTPSAVEVAEPATLGWLTLGVLGLCLRRRLPRA